MLRRIQPMIRLKDFIIVLCQDGYEKGDNSKIPADGFESMEDERNGDSFWLSGGRVVGYTECTGKVEDVVVEIFLCCRWSEAINSCDDRQTDVC